MLDMSHVTRPARIKHSLKRHAVKAVLGALLVTNIVLTLMGCAHVPHESVGLVQVTFAGEDAGSATMFAVAPYELITAHHVCVTVLEGGAELSSPILGALEVIAWDPDSDLCLLSSRVPLRPLRLANYARVEQDDEASILGFPLGVGQILTRGTVSEPYLIIEGRPLLLLSVPSTFGNSGSPVLNSAGEVIGMLSMGVRQYPQIALATPGSDLKAFLDWAHGPAL